MEGPLKEDVTFETGHGAACGIWSRPAEAVATYVLAHGAGAGMRHVFMKTIADALNERRIATLRYEFLYMSSGSKRPDREPVLLDTVRAAVAFGHQLAPDLPVFAGGKSMGGRMTSRAAAAAPLDVNGIIFIGFPLHPPKRVSRDRAAHLHDVKPAMLFLQGTRDDLADLDSIREVTAGLRDAELHVVEGADHSFHVLKRSGRTDAEVMNELVDRIATFVAAHSMPGATR
ncbi:MAG TPA: alpha/beta family hydrolase [Longimicrobiales bacterium]